MVTIDTGTFILDQGGWGDGDGGQEIEGDLDVNSIMYRRYHRSEMISAINAVKKGISAPKAAKLFKVPIRTLYSKMKRLGIKYNVGAITKRALEEHEGDEEEDERVTMARRIRMEKINKRRGKRKRGGIRKSERLKGEIVKEENSLKDESEKHSDLIGGNRWEEEDNWGEGFGKGGICQKFSGNLARYAIEAVRRGKSAKEAVRIFNIDSDSRAEEEDIGKRRSESCEASGEPTGDIGEIRCLVEEGEMNAGEDNGEEYFDQNIFQGEEEPSMGPTSELKEEIDVKRKSSKVLVSKATKRKGKRKGDDDEDFKPGK